VLLALVLPACALAQTPTPTTLKQGNQSHRVPTPAPKDQEQFIVYWTTEPGWNTELLLRNNREADDLVVTPSVRTPDGSESMLPAVTISPGDVATVDLRETLLKTAPHLAGGWGSLALRYSSRVNGALYSSVMVRADGRPIAFHLDGFGRGSTYETGSREGVWWLPRPEVTDYLILANSGDRPVQPRLVLYDASGKTWQQSLAIPAHQSLRLSIRTLLGQSGLQGSYGGFKIDIAQGARFLDSTHVLFEQSGGFSAVMKMFRHDPRATFASRAFGNVKEWTTRAPMLALSTPDPALGLPAATTLQPMLFVHNTLAKTVTAHLRFNWRSATNTGNSAPIDLILKANETKVVDVSALQDGKTLPNDANWASVVLSAPVLPDDLLAVAASYDQTGRYGAQTPFNDQLASHWEGGKWEVDSAHNSLSMIINGGNKPVVAELTIFYNQGKGQYQIQRQLAPEEQMFVDFGKLIHNQVPDKNGQTLPRDLMSGAYRVRDLTDSAAASLYEGKVVVDKTFGHVSYGCMICCGPTSAAMMYDPLTVSVGGYADQDIQAMDSCSETFGSILDDFPNWWTDNTSIATASYGGVSGVGVGTTYHRAQSVMMYFGPLEDSGGGPCPQDQEEPSAQTNVPPTITGPNEVWWFANLSPAGYATSITLSSNGGTSTTWAVTSGASKVLVTGTGSQITVQSSGTDFSTQPNDVAITASTPAGGTSQPFTITTRKPSQLVPGIFSVACDGVFGYITHLPYTIQDQLPAHNNMPAPIGVNESWTSAVTADYIGENWPRPDPNGITTTASAPASFEDLISGANLFTHPFPTPNCNQSSTAVHHWGDVIKVLGEVPGTGVTVQTNSLQREIGRGAHVGIVSPVP
jgi:hypothetical protein